MSWLGSSNATTLTGSMELDYAAIFASGFAGPLLVRAECPALLYSVFLTLSGVCVCSSGYPAQRRCCVPRSEDVDCRQSPLASRVLLGRACCLYCSSSLARGPPADGLLCVGVWTASRCSDESWSIVARSP